MLRVGGFAVARDGVGDDACFETFLLLIALFFVTVEYVISSSDAARILQPARGRGTRPTLRYATFV